MTDRYVDPSVGASGTGESWAQAYKTLKEATDAAAAGETIYFHNGTADAISADKTYTLAAGVRVISTSDKTNNPPTTYAAGASVDGTGTSSVDITIQGPGSYWGVAFKVGNGANRGDLIIGATDDVAPVFTDCSFYLSGTNTGTNHSIGWLGTGLETVIKFINCSWYWGHAGQAARLYANAYFYGCNFSAGETHPTVLFEEANTQGTQEFYGCDFSNIATILVASAYSYIVLKLHQCLLKASSTIFAPDSIANGEVYAFDCNSGDVHYSFYHASYLGSTTISTSVYANDNIADTNLSWVVAGTANTTKANPYHSPWIDVYHAGTSAITPYLEVLRLGSTTSYLESEAWIDVLAKTTSGSTKSTLYSNRANPLDTTTDNTDSAKGAGDWTGEDASNNWFGKLILNAAITPAEVGHIRARVGLAGQYTLYVDPQIRGLA